MPKLKERERNEAIGMLKSCAINHVAAFYNTSRKPYDFCKEEQIRQELSKIDHGMVGLGRQQMQVTVQYEFYTSETDLNLQARPCGL